MISQNQTLARCYHFLMCHELAAIELNKVATNIYPPIMVPSALWRLFRFFPDSLLKGNLISWCGKEVKFDDSWGDAVLDKVEKPWRCLCLGLALHIIKILRLLRTTWQDLHIFFTDDFTFILDNELIGGNYIGMTMQSYVRPIWFKFFWNSIILWLSKLIIWRRLMI